ncbi:hypothetical protein F906_02880 [Acinetobacter pseudolwoffii]|uniref:Uncharacterized protein n=1 Tax=Acinetobacter pseudolwoffii TaxID=2053287 RepID=N9KM28_9GAMM|nr:hypothetical protein [Acinetobacter pseudolwoffii]ENW85092.1 hypothetical protein F906_02880 [Acinetobacter pseudolwoffii]
MSYLIAKHTHVIEHDNEAIYAAYHVADFALSGALLHKDLKCKAPLIEPNLRRNLGKWST